MEARERIEQLEKEIEQLQLQLKAIKQQTKIDWSKYYAFGNGKYSYGALVGENDPTGYIRQLAQRLCSLYAKEITKGEPLSIWHNDMPRISKLTKEQAEYINGFIDECYPIIEKYALISLERNKELPKSVASSAQKGLKI